MTDQADNAEATTALFLSIACRTKRKELLKTGKCHNCKDECKGSYCSPECREDAELRAKMKGLNYEMDR